MYNVQCMMYVFAVFGIKSPFGHSIAGIYTAPPRPPKFESTPLQARRKVPPQATPKNFGMLQRCIK